MENSTEVSSAGFVPLHLLFDWIELGTTTRRHTVALLLPSGVVTGMFSVRVSEDGLFLELTVSWPGPFIDLKHLHRKWLASKENDRIKLFRPKLIGFETSLTTCRTKDTEYEKSTSRIDLVFQVQTHIYEKYNLGLSDSSAKDFYVELRGK